jgi:hypothetical protein
LSQSAIATSLSRLFGVPFSRGGVNHLKETAAAKYRAAYDDILRRIVTGKLIHADETKARVQGRDGYVWVFTSLEEVAFVYRATREAKFMRKMLKMFRAVLVSDYFSVYDSIPCLQQKCLKVTGFAILRLRQFLLVVVRVNQMRKASQIQLRPLGC